MLLLYRLSDQNGTLFLLLSKEKYLASILKPVTFKKSITKKSFRFQIQLIDFKIS